MRLSWPFLFFWSRIIQQFWRKQGERIPQVYWQLFSSSNNSSFMCTATEAQRSLASLYSVPWFLQTNCCPHSFSEMGYSNCSLSYIWNLHKRGHFNSKLSSLSCEMKSFIYLGINNNSCRMQSLTQTASWLLLIIIKLLIALLWQLLLASFLWVFLIHVIFI